MVDNLRPETQRHWLSRQGGWWALHGKANNIGPGVQLALGHDLALLETVRDADCGLPVPAWTLPADKPSGKLDALAVGLGRRPAR